MSQRTLFYLKSTSETPLKFKEKFLSKKKDNSQIFKAVTTFSHYNVVFNRANQPLPWSIRSNFNYVQLYWSIGTFVKGKEKMKLRSGKEVIIVRLAIKGLFLLIVRISCFLKRIRIKIEKKRLYLLGILSNNNQSILNILSGHDLIKEQIYVHAFKKRKLS